MNNNSYTPCAEVNKVSGKEGMCRETNGSNIVLLDPSGSITNDTVNHEDLFTYVSLKARVRTKSLLVKKPETKMIEATFIKQQTSNVTEPLGKSFLTTDWTNVGSFDSKIGEDLETFGITNIDINFNSGFIPQIVIDFIDIRGATLFEQGSCSPYGAFFHQPYPIFELMVKGFYGYPVNYFLSIKSFNTKFNAETGNYESRGEFIGYSYAFLSDISLGYILAAPYMEGSDDILKGIYEKYLDYYDDVGYNSDDGGTKFNPIGSDGKPMTLYNYTRSVQKLEGGADGKDTSIIDRIKGSQELRDLTETEDLEGILEDLSERVSDFKVSWEDKGGKVKDNIASWTNTSSDSSETNKDLTILYGAHFSENTGLGTRITYYNNTISENFPGAEEGLLIPDGLTTLDTSDGLTVDLNPLVKQLNDKQLALETKLKKTREEFSEKTNNLLKSEEGIGFIPTIRSFFTVLLANTELFLELVRKASSDAEAYHIEKNSDEKIINSRGNKSAVSEIVYAWPTYATDVDGINKETYPGTNSNFREWPEVKFVEDFLKALIQMNKDVNDPDGDNTDNIKWENIKGYDNYVAINAMETPAAFGDSNISYYNITDEDDAYKTIGERFIALTNMSGLHSNFLNSSLILRSRNLHQRYINNDGFFDAGVDATFTHLEEMVIKGKSPYLSAGIPFNPTKFGGLDANFGDSLTFNVDLTNDIGGVKGYPTMLRESNYFSSVPTTKIQPMGMIQGKRQSEIEDIEETGSGLFYRSVLHIGDELDHLTANNYGKIGWGYMEGVNFANSIDAEVILDIVTETSKTPNALMQKVIKSLGYTFNDENSFVDKFNNSWRYNKDIRLTPKSENVEVVLKPNIHDMDIDSLITMVPCAECTSAYKGTGWATNLKGAGSRNLNLNDDNILLSPNAKNKDYFLWAFGKYGTNPITAKRSVDLFHRDIQMLNGVNANTVIKQEWWRSNGLFTSKFAPYLHGVGARGDQSRTSVDSDKKYTKTSIFSQTSSLTMPDMCIVEIYPDFDFNYKAGGYDKLKGNKLLNKGDFNYRYIDNIKEINNNNGRSLEFNDSTTITVSGESETISSTLSSGWYTLLPSYTKYSNNETYYDYSHESGTIKKSILLTHPKWTSMKVVDYSPASKQFLYSSIPDIEDTYSNAGSENKKVSNILQQGRNNVNFINQGNTLIDTPFWRHNFPSLDVASETINSFSYSMFGSPTYSVYKNINGGDSNTDNGGVKAKSNFYIGIKNDLDIGLGSYIGFKPSQDSNIDSDERINMLTTHNKDVFNVKASDDNKSIETFTPTTNLNRTKQWKGSLAYLFLANQLHRPWTGMYTNNDTYYGPQSVLGTASMSTIIPNHSVFLLGAVLWRMRESGLLISDDEKWNMEPKDSSVTYNDGEYVDPINVPILPKNLTYESPLGLPSPSFSFEHFGYDTMPEVVTDITNNTYNWNNGVRPPMASLFVNGNPHHSDTVTGKKGSKTGVICFPRADEWPVPNLGMINAIDLDEVPGFTNPFKNQYKIFTPILGAKGSLALRIPNQTLRWLTNEKAITAFKDDIDRINDEVKRDVRNYGATYKRKVDAQFFKWAEDKADDAASAVGTTLNAYIEGSERFAGYDESYTKLSYIYHDIAPNVINEKDPTKENGRSLRGDKKQQIRSGSRTNPVKTQVKWTFFYYSDLINVKSLVIGNTKTVLPLGGSDGNPEIINAKVTSISHEIEGVATLGTGRSDDKPGSYKLSTYTPGTGTRPSTTQVTSQGTGLLKGTRGRTFIINVEGDALKLENNATHTDRGYLRGYLPMGPEIWFLPTKVKEKFISEFEKYVGVFNEFGTSQFDETLRTIDPLNFPRPTLTRSPDVGSGILPNDLVYETFGNITNNINTPWALQVGGEEPAPHSAVDTWLQTYSLGTQSKSGGGVQKDSATITKLLVNKLNNGNTNVKSIHAKLFNDGIIFSQSTPRIWWAELPLDDVPDWAGGFRPKETTFDHFYFNEQEFEDFCNGFGDALKSPEIKKQREDKIGDDLAKNLGDGGSDDEDLKLTTYRSIKSLYDKWISSSESDGSLFFNAIGANCNREDRLLVDHFSFVDRVNADIGDKALVNIEVFNSLLNNVTNSLFGLTSDVLDKSNFNFHPLPSYVDLSLGISKLSTDTTNGKIERLANMFVPQTQSKIFDCMGGPHFLCMYVGGNSKALDLTGPVDMGGCVNDGGNLLDERRGDSFPLSNPPIDYSKPESRGVVGFKVAFGSENQSHFIGIDLDQSEHKNTNEALLAIEKIANVGDPGGSNGLISKSQSLYEVFLNRSYSCTVEAMGNMMIQPLQYFELENVPMFYGSYLIRDVKHKITPHDVKTTFTGDRIPQAVVPIIDDIVAAFNLAPSDTVTGSIGGIDGTNTSTGNNSRSSTSKGCTGGGGIKSWLKDNGASNGLISTLNEVVGMTTVVIPGVTVNASTSRQLLTPAVTPLIEMLTDLKNYLISIGYTKKQISVSSLYRSSQYQAQLCLTNGSNKGVYSKAQYDSKKGTVWPPKWNDVNKCPAGTGMPGRSTHGWGLAVDIQFYKKDGKEVAGGTGSKDGFASDQYRWLWKNGYRYGWVSPTWARGGKIGDDEHWHWEYQGKAATSFMKKNSVFKAKHAQIPDWTNIGEVYDFVKNPILKSTGVEASINCKEGEGFSQPQPDGTSGGIFVPDTYNGADKGQASKTKANRGLAYEKKLGFIGYIT